MMIGHDSAPSTVPEPPQISDELAAKLRKLGEVHERPDGLLEAFDGKERYVITSPGQYIERQTKAMVSLMIEEIVLKPLAEMIGGAIFGSQQKPHTGGIVTPPVSRTPGEFMRGECIRSPRQKP